MRGGKEVGRDKGGEGRRWKGGEEVKGREGSDVCPQIQIQLLDPLMAIIVIYFFCKNFLLPCLRTSVTMLCCVMEFQ